MNQSAMKAATLRSFQYFMAEITQTPEAMRGPRGPLRAAMFRAFVAADIVMRGSGKFFTPEQKIDCTNQFRDAMFCYHALTVECSRLGLHLYKWLPKHHCLVHIVMDYGSLSPRKVTCMQDEDFVGRAKRLYNGCHGATHERQRRHQQDSSSFPER